MNHVALIIQLRYFILIPLFIFEGPATTFVAAILASKGIFESNDIIELAIACNVLSDLGYYAIGRWGGNAFISRWGKHFHLDYQKMVRFEKYFAKHAGKALVLGKMSVAFGSLALFAAGITKYNVWKFTGYNLVAEIPKTWLIFGLGYYFGSTIGNFNHDAAVYGIIFTLVVVLGFLSYRATKGLLAAESKRV